MNLGKLLGSIAPTLATVLGGPMAGGAVKALVSGLLGDEVPEDQHEEQLNKAIANADPETLAKIKQIDVDYKLRLKELGIRPDEMIYADKADARAMQVENKSAVPATLSFILTVGFFSCLASLFFLPIPDENKASIYSMLGMLGTVWLGAMQFWYGTTKGSMDKNTLIGRKK